MTPGPNNLMLMASGANFGFWRSVPHMFGVGIGFVIMVLLVGIGLVQVFDAYPVSYTILKTGSVIYLGWLAWKIANAAPPDATKAPGHPMTFLQAALFQWVNPKAWAMALSSISAYAPAKTVPAILLVALVFAMTSITSTSSWTLIGQQMRRLLTNPMRLRVFNWTMAILLIASLKPVIFP